MTSAKRNALTALLAVGAMAIIIGWHSSASEGIASLKSALISSTISHDNLSLAEVTSHAGEMVASVNRSRHALWIASLGAFVAVLSFLALWSDFRKQVESLAQREHLTRSHSQSTSSLRDEAP